MNSWSLQYQTPTMDVLLGQLKPEYRETLESVRSWLSTNSEQRPKLDYAGIAWHWNERFTFEPTKGGALRCACLIPDPEQPRVAICCDRGFFQTHPPSMIPKALHAGLGDGICIGQLAWCTWGISSVDTAQAMVELLDQMISE